MTQYEELDISVSHEAPTELPFAGPGTGWQQALAWMPRWPYPLHVRTKAFLALSVILEQRDTVQFELFDGTWPQRYTKPHEFSFAITLKGADITDHIAVLLGLCAVRREGRVVIPVASKRTMSVDQAGIVYDVMRHVAYHMFPDMRGKWDYDFVETPGR